MTDSDLAIYRKNLFLYFLELISLEICVMKEPVGKFILIRFYNQYKYEIVMRK